MVVEASDSVFREALDRLRGGPTAMAWPDRRVLGCAIGEALGTGTATNVAITLAHVLAADPKWEVRLAVADTLLNLPEDDFHRLAGQLAQDANAYVRRSVERARERRRDEQRANGKTRRSTDQVNEQLQAIEAEYGKAAAAKALRTCERYTELLVGSMVHDLRSMLTHLKMNCYSLIESHPGDKPGSKSRRAAARVRSDLDFMELAIADMEVFARPVASERRPERLADVIAAALELACDNVRKSKLDPDAVNVKLDVPGVIVVEMARHQITLALANVLKNAFEAFLADGKLRAGSIQIEVVAVGDQVRITVRDDGMGMVEEESRGLLFFTPGRRNKSKQNSTGYGLPIAARNVAAHGGSIALESRGNEGTVVTIILPLSSL